MAWCRALYPLCIRESKVSGGHIVCCCRRFARRYCRLLCSSWMYSAWGNYPECGGTCVTVYLPLGALAQPCYDLAHMSEQQATPALNERSRTVLDFIRGFVRRHRVAPSIREIMAGCDLTTTSVVEYYLQRLEREGYLRRSMRTGTYRAPRGIVLVDSQSPSAALPGRRGARVAKLIASLERIFPVGADPECDICGQAPKTEDDRFCAGCRRWLERFARTTSPAHAGEDLARCLAAMLRSGERPAEWSVADAHTD